MCRSFLRLWLFQKVTDNSQLYRVGGHRFFLGFWPFQCKRNASCQKRMETPHKTVRDEELKIFDSYITKIWHKSVPELFPSISHQFYVQHLEQWRGGSTLVPCYPSLWGGAITASPSSIWNTCGLSAVTSRCVQHWQSHFLWSTAWANGTAVLESWFIITCLGYFSSTSTFMFRSSL